MDNNNSQGSDEQSPFTVPESSSESSSSDSSSNEILKLPVLSGKSVGQGRLSSNAVKKPKLRIFIKDKKFAEPKPFQCPTTRNPGSSSQLLPSNRVARKSKRVRANASEVTSNTVIPISKTLKLLSEIFQSRFITSQIVQHLSPADFFSLKEGLVMIFGRHQFNHWPNAILDFETAKVCFATQKSLYLIVDPGEYNPDFQYTQSISRDCVGGSGVFIPELPELPNLPLASESKQVLTAIQIQNLLIQTRSEQSEVTTKISDYFPKVTSLKVVLRHLDKNVKTVPSSYLDRRRRASESTLLTQLTKLTTYFSSQLVCLRIHIADLRPPRLNLASAKYTAYLQLKQNSTKAWNQEDLEFLFSSLSRASWPRLQHLTFALDEVKVDRSNHRDPFLISTHLKIFYNIREIYLRLPGSLFHLFLLPLQVSSCLKKVGIVLTGSPYDSDWLFRGGDDNFASKLVHFVNLSLSGHCKFVQGSAGNSKIDNFGSFLLSSHAHLLELFTSLQVMDFHVTSAGDFTTIVRQIAKQSLPELTTLVPTLVLNFNKSKGNLEPFRQTDWQDECRLTTITDLRLTVYSVLEQGKPEPIGTLLASSLFNHESFFQALGAGFPGSQFPKLQKLTLRLEGVCSICGTPMLITEHCQLAFISSLKKMIFDSDKVLLSGLQVLNLENTSECGRAVVECRGNETKDGAAGEDCCTTTAESV